jgi:hypothetical protein
MKAPSILHQLGASTSFTPMTIDQYFALQLARKFKDLNRIGQYSSVVNRLPLQRILKSYAQAQNYSTEQARRERFFELCEVH